MYSIHIYKNNLFFAIVAAVVFVVGMTGTNSIQSETEAEAATYQVAISVPIDTGYSGNSDGTTAWTATSSQVSAYGGRALTHSLNGNPSTTSPVGSITSTSNCFPGGSDGSGTTGSILLGSNTAGTSGVLNFKLSSGVSNAKAAMISVISIDAGNFLTVNGTSQSVFTGDLYYSFVGTSTITMAVTEATRLYITNIVLTADVSSSTISMAMSKADAVVGISKTLTLTTSTQPASPSIKSKTWSSSDTSIASVSSGGAVTGVSVGTATITAVANDGSGVSCSCEITVYTAVTGVTATRSLAGLAVGYTMNVTATILPSDAYQSLVWSTSNATIATVSEDGLVSGLAVGTTTIKAKAQDGSGKYASLTVPVTIPATEVTIGKSNENGLGVGKKLTVSAAVLPSGASTKMAWSSEDTAIATVSSTGSVTGVSAGTIHIIGTVQDGTGVSAMTSVTVYPAATSIVITRSLSGLAVGYTMNVLANVLPAGAYQPVVWTSSVPEVATVDMYGLVTALSEGTTVIKATACDATGKTGSITVPVTIPAESLTLAKSSEYGLATGKNLTVTPTILPSGASAKVLWSSSDSSIATVSSLGVVTGVSNGNAIIFCTAQDGSGISNSVSIDVFLATTGLALTRSIAGLAVGYSMNVFANILPTGAYPDLTWTSSVPTVAAVDSFGVVTGISTGTTSIRATARDGTGKYASLSVTVTNPTTSLTINKSSLILGTGRTTSITATRLPSNSYSSLRWSSSDPSVATVSSSGVVTGVTNGSATITAATRDGTELSATCDVSIFIAATGVSLNKSHVTLNLNSTDQLIATVIPEDATNKAVTWSTSNSKIATVSVDGLVKLVGKGSTATITVKTADGSYKATCVYTWSGDEAISYANSFLSETSVCDATGLSDNISAIWPNLSVDYAALSDVAKDYFYSGSETAIANAKARYQYIIGKYPALKAQDNFMKSSSGALIFPSTENITETNAEYSRDLMFAVSVIGLLSLLVGFWENRRRNRLASK